MTSAEGNDGIGIPNADAPAGVDARAVLRGVRSIALVGASHKPARPSHQVMEFLLARGYEVFPVNPGLAGKQLLGRLVFASLADLPRPVDMIDIFQNTRAAGHTVEAALALPWRPKVIWMQLGIVNETAARKARAAGIAVIMDRCPKIELARD